MTGVRPPSGQFKVMVSVTVRRKLPKDATGWTSLRTSSVPAAAAMCFIEAALAESAADALLYAETANATANNPI